MLLTTGTEHCAGAGIEKTAVTAMPCSALKCSITKLPIAPQPITAIFNGIPCVSLTIENGYRCMSMARPTLMLTMWST
jgi:hypothetical protein